GVANGGQINAFNRCTTYPLRSRLIRAIGKYTAGNRLLRLLRTTGTTGQQQGSGRQSDRQGMFHGFLLENKNGTAAENCGFENSGWNARMPPYQINKKDPFHGVSYAVAGRCRVGFIVA